MSVLVPVLACISALLAFPSAVFASWPDCGCAPSGAGVAFADVAAVAAAGAGDAEAETSCDIAPCVLRVRRVVYDMMERAQAARVGASRRSAQPGTRAFTSYSSREGQERRGRAQCAAEAADSPAEQRTVLPSGCRRCVLHQESCCLLAVLPDNAAAGRKLVTQEQTGSALS